MQAIAQREQAPEVWTTAVEASAPWSAQIVGFSEIEADWRWLEQHGELTPYQTCDWVRSYAAEALDADGARLAIVAIRSAQGRTLAILPLAIRRRIGLRTASFIGGKHANFHMGVFAPGVMQRLDAEGARRMLRDAAAALGAVDAFVLPCQPEAWNGITNPFALVEGQPSANPAYKLVLEGDIEATFQSAMSSHARKKHKNKRARFAELGASSLIVPQTDAEKEAVLATFHRQKAQRFAQMGIDNPFADARVAHFLRRGAGLDGGQPALFLAALDLNGTLVATYIGAEARGRFSGMATSFEPDPVAMKYSPGEILLVDLIRHRFGHGITVFDLGVGEARYKSTFCNQTDNLVDSFVAISPAGKILAAAMRVAAMAKGAVKRSPRLYGALMSIKRLGQKPRSSGVLTDPS
ncbi:MAG: GNAT family N-acetyltransferase [Beijerinckiaceae bacterium]|nr:GNAT family N-acetyltransferase [Beijerinckiaceae bacterium]